MPVCPPIAISLPIPTGAQCLVNGESYDRGLMHFRRYDMLDLEAKLRAAGMRPTEAMASGFHDRPCLLADQEALAAARPKRRSGAPGGVVNSTDLSKRAGILGHGLMRLEAALRSRLYLPLGVRCLVRAECR